MSIKKRIRYSDIMLPIMGLFIFMPSMAYAGSVYIGGSSAKSSSVHAEASVKSRLSDAVNTANKINNKKTHNKSTKKSSKKTNLAVYTTAKKSASSSFAQNYSLGVGAQVNNMTGQLQLTFTTSKIPGMSKTSAVKFGFTNGAPTNPDSPGSLILGFPKGYQPEVDYILEINGRKKLYTGAGKSFYIDSGYKSASGFAGGLEYLPGRTMEYRLISNEGGQLEIKKTLSNGITIYYASYLKDSKGNMEYFDRGGKEIADVDTNGNAVAYIYAQVSPVTHKILKTANTDINTLNVNQSVLTDIIGCFGAKNQDLQISGYGSSTITVQMPDLTHYLYKFDNMQNPQNITVTGPSGRSTIITNKYNTANQILSTKITYATGGYTTYTYSTAASATDDDGIMYMENGKIAGRLPAVLTVKVSPGSGQPDVTTTYNYDPNGNGTSFTGGAYNGKYAGDGSYSGTHDSLMQSNNNNYRYSTAISKTWNNQETNSADTIKNVETFNFLHLPVQKETYFNGTLKSTTKINYIGGGPNDSDFNNYDNLASNYNLPDNVKTYIGSTPPSESTKPTFQVATQFDTVYGLPQMIESYNNDKIVSTTTYLYQFGSKKLNESGGQTMAPYNGLFSSQSITYVNNDSNTSANSTKSTITVTNALPVLADSSNPSSWYIPSVTKTVKNTAACLNGLSGATSLVTTRKVNSGGLQTSSTLAYAASSANSSDQPQSSTSSMSYANISITSPGGTSYPCWVTTTTNAQGESNSAAVDIRNGRVVRKMTTSWDGKPIYIWYSYSNNGLVKTTTYPNGAWSKVDNSKSPDIITATSSSGVIKTETLDGIGQVLKESIQYPSSTNSSSATIFTTLKTYNGLGKVAAVTGPDGRTASYTYNDWKGRSTKTVGPMGNIQTTVYDDSGLTSTSYLTTEGSSANSSPIKLSTAYYNKQGKIIKQINFTGAVNKSAEYNGLKQIITSSLYNLTPESNAVATPIISSSSAYGISGKRIYYNLRSKDGMNATSTWTRGLFGQIIHRTTNFTAVSPGVIKGDGAVNSETKYYNNIGHLVKMTNGLNHSESWTYYPNGKMKTYTDMGGIKHKYTYNISNKVLTDTWSGGQVIHTYYPIIKGSASIFSGKLKSTKLTDSDGGLMSEIDYTYDPIWGKIQTITDIPSPATDPAGKTMSFEYGLVNGGVMLTSYTDYAGVKFIFYYYQTSQYPHLSGNDIKSVTAAYKGRFISSMSYVYYSNISNVDNPALYGSGNTIESVTYGNGINVKYTYDTSGNNSNKLDAAPPMQKIKNPKLKSICTKNKEGVILSQTIYGYTPQGNISSQMMTSGISTGSNSNNYKKYIYNDQNQLLKSSVYALSGIRIGQLIRETKYTYDVNGNVVLKTVKGNKGTIISNLSYLYNNSNNQYVNNELDAIIGTENNVKVNTQLIYDPNGNIIEITNESGRLKYQFFTYNQLNMMTEYEADNTNIKATSGPHAVSYSYSYYPDGIRKMKTNNNYNVSQ